MGSNLTKLLVLVEIESATGKGVYGHGTSDGHTIAPIVGMRSSQTKH